MSSSKKELHSKLDQTRHSLLERMFLSSFMGESSSDEERMKGKCTEVKGEGVPGRGEGGKRGEGAKGTEVKGEGVPG